MKAIWVFSMFLAVACSSSEGPGTECVDPARKNPDGICTYIYQPVCGCNGVTYSNACIAANEGVLKWSEGACPE